MGFSTLGNTGICVSRLAINAMTFAASKRDLASRYTVDDALADRLAARTSDADVISLTRSATTRPANPRPGLEPRSNRDQAISSSRPRCVREYELA